MSTKGGVVPREEPVAAKQGKKKSCMRHCKRFWWIYLIVFILAVVLIVCLIIFVAVPKIAQGKLNHAELTVDGIVISQTRGETYNMAINSTIRSDGGVSATIAPFTAAMYLEDLEAHTPFVYLNFPETSSVKLQTVNTTQDITVPDMEAFTVFNTWLLGNESLRVTVEGKTHVRVKGLARNYGVTFKKTLELTGLNHFKGINVTYNTVALMADKKGDNFHGFVDIPNPSVLTIDIGNTSYNTFLDGKLVGPTYIDDLVLYPGINNVSMRANISQADVLRAMGSDPYCKDGIVPFDLEGKSVENAGEDLPYFTNALGAANVTVDINLGESFERDLSLTFDCPKRS